MGINVKTLCDKYDFQIVAASYVGRPLNNTVMYVTKKVEHLIANLKDSRECLIFAEDTIDVPKELMEHNCFIMTDNPQRSYAQFVQTLAQDRENRDMERRYTMTEEGYFIGENVKIGEGAIIEPLCFIGHDVEIGKNARIKAGAKIKNAIIGDNFIAGENCTIGTFGFTMADDLQKNKIRIPTLGKVIIGNNVEVGALTNISVGSGGNTVIEDHVKLDSLVHIGHDVHLNRNVELPAGAIIGGFVEMGERAYVGINAVVRNRVNIGENAVVGMGSVVTKSVDPNTTVVGNPARLFEKKK